MIWVYGFFGAILGIVLGIILCGGIFDLALKNPSVADGFQSANSGVSGIFLGAIASAFIIGLGGATGCLVVHLLGKYRLTASQIMALFGGAASLLSLWQGLSFSRGYGREAAFAIFGVYFVWSICLMVSGLYFISKNLDSG